MMHSKAAATPEEVWPDQGSLLDGLHPCVESGTLKRARVMNMTIDYMNLDEKDILVQEIGQVDAEIDFRPAVRQNMRDRHFEATKKKVQDELDRWKMLQGDYNDYVRYLRLNQQKVLRMPVFAPVPPGDHKSVLRVVRGKLLDFFRNDYVYNVFRWQHIGCRHRDGNLELILLDLESLKEVTDETEDHVTQQIKSLQDLWELRLPVPLLVPFLQRMRLACRCANRHNE
eukprot:scaffold92029_cov64-Attheya_sp.AAC.1